MWNTKDRTSQSDPVHEGAENSRRQFSGTISGQLSNRNVCSTHNWGPIYTHVGRIVYGVSYVLLLMLRWCRESW